MMEINGTKYISEEDFDNGVNTCIEEIFEFVKTSGITPSTGALLTMTIISEFAKLGVELFDKKKSEEENSKKEDK